MLLRIILAISLFSFINCQAGLHQNADSLQVKPCRLKGQWQLVKTFTQGAFHVVAKSEYDDVVTYKNFHSYKEEVNYESQHWIITGKWKLSKRKGTLELYKRKYALGSMGNLSAQITLQLLNLNKTGLSGSTTEAGAPLKMFYARL